MEGFGDEMWRYVHPELVWWDEDQEGPIHHRDLMCQFCNEYLVAVHVTEFHTWQSVWVCHLCGVFFVVVSWKALGAGRHLLDAMA